MSASANDRAKLASPVRERLQSWGLSPLTGALLLAWASSMVLLPIFLWTVGPAALPWSASMTVILQLLCVLAVLRQSWQPLDLTRATLIVFAGAWLIEWAGSKTGFIFGTYDYTNLFRPQLAGVPSIVPLAWLMMLPPAWAVSQALTRRTAGVAFLLASAVAFTAWDLFLDPQMVAWGAWVWPDGGGYFDIPWHNFAGWIAGALLLTALVRPRRARAPASRRLFSDLGAPVNRAGLLLAIAWACALWVPGDGRLDDCGLVEPPSHQSRGR